MNWKDWWMMVAAILGSIKLTLEILEKFEERFAKWKKDREKKKKRSTKKRKR